MPVIIMNALKIQPAAGLSVTFTDSIYLAGVGPPYFATYDVEGMTLSVSGGVPPYTYQFECLSIREFDIFVADWGVATPGCVSTLGSEITGVQSLVTFNTSTFTSCATTTPLTEADMAGLVIWGIINGALGSAGISTEIKITVTDSLNNTGSDIAHARHAPELLG